MIKFEATICEKEGGKLTLRHHVTPELVTQKEAAFTMPFLDLAESLTKPPRETPPTVTEDEHEEPLQTIVIPIDQEGLTLFEQRFQEVITELVMVSHYEPPTGVYLGPLLERIQEKAREASGRSLEALAKWRGREQETFATMIEGFSTMTGVAASFQVLLAMIAASQGAIDTEDEN